MISLSVIVCSIVQLAVSVTFVWLIISFLVLYNLVYDYNVLIFLTWQFSLQHLALNPFLPCLLCLVVHRMKLNGYQRLGKRIAVPWKNTKIVRKTGASCITAY